MYRLSDVQKEVLVKRLRDEVSCGVMTAKKCLVEANYEYDKALAIYKDKGYLSDKSCLIYRK